MPSPIQSVCRWWPFSFHVSKSPSDTGNSSWPTAEPNPGLFTFPPGPVSCHSFCPHVLRRTCSHPAFQCSIRAAHTGTPALTGKTADEEPALTLRMDGNCSLSQATNTPLQNQFSPEYKNPPCPDMTTAGTYRTDPVWQP